MVGTPRYTEEKIKAMILRYIQKYNRIPKRHECNNSKELPSIGIILKFGGWKYILDSLGYDKNIHHISHSKEWQQKMRVMAKKRFRNNHGYNWKGGTHQKDGYIMVWDKNNPMSNKHGYVPEHRLIISKYLNRPLESDEIVHHRNGIKNDNRIENLEIVTIHTHYGKVRCPHCLKEFSIK